MKSEPIGDAVGWVRDGGLLAYPTETVWALGADSRSDAAVARLTHWKGRDASEPISILVADAEELKKQSGLHCKTLAGQIAELGNRVFAGVVGNPAGCVHHAYLPDIFVCIRGQQRRQCLLSTFSCPHQLQAEGTVTRVGE